MSNTAIQIKRSTVTAAPTKLNIGELGYSYTSNTLYIGSRDGQGALALAGNAFIGMYQTMYDRSNTAYTASVQATADVGAAFLKANLAYNQANSAYTSQNASGSYANSAFAKANGAYDQANSAYTSQNASGSYANSAFAKANGAYDQANTPKANLVNSSYTAQLHSNGAFALPGTLIFGPSKGKITNEGAGVLAITANSGNTGLVLDDAGQGVLYGKTGVLIQTNEGLFDSPTKDFLFGQDGTLTFPDATVQSTGFRG